MQAVYSPTFLEICCIKPFLHKHYCIKSGFFVVKVQKRSIYLVMSQKILV